MIERVFLSATRLRFVFQVECENDACFCESVANSDAGNEMMFSPEDHVCNEVTLRVRYHQRRLYAMCSYDQCRAYVLRMASQQVLRAPAAF